MNCTLVRLAVVSICGTLLSPATLAQSDRGQNWEVSVGIGFTGSEDIGGENGSGLDIDSDEGLSLGIHYNLSPKLAVGFDSLYVEPRYKATFTNEDGSPTTISHRLSIYSGQFNGTWNFIDGPLTPFIQGGLGWTYVDSNIADGPPVTECWWDPWWGYICSDFFDTYNETEFSWGLGAGLRYDLGRQMFVKATYNWLSIDSEVDLDVDSFKLEVGWRF